MKLHSQSGLSLIHIITILSGLAILFGFIAAMTSDKVPESADPATSDQAADTPTPLESLAQQEAEEITAPATDAMAANEEKMQETKAEIEFETTTGTSDEVVAPVVASEPEPEPAADPVPTPEPTPAPVASTPGTFTDYSPAALTANGTNVLFFHASWCPSCRGLENDISRNTGDIPSNVTILKLDYDSETELKKKYGVVRQHTLVIVDGNGNEVRKLTGLTNTLNQVVNQL